MTKTKKLKVTLKRSKAGIIPKHKACVQGLGLKRINQSVIVTNDPCMLGMIKKVSYLVTVEEV